MGCKYSDKIGQFRILLAIVTRLNQISHVVLRRQPLSPVITYFNPLSPVISRCYPSSPVVTSNFLSSVNTHCHLSSPTATCRHLIPTVVTHHPPKYPLSSVVMVVILRQPSSPVTLLKCSKFRVLMKIQREKPYYE